MILDFFRLIQVYWLHTVVRCRCMVRFSDFRFETPSCNKFYAIKIKITNFYFCFKTFLGTCINALAMLKMMFWQLHNSTSDFGSSWFWDFPDDSDHDRCIGFIQYGCWCMVRFSDVRVDTTSCDKIYAIKINFAE